MKEFIDRDEDQSELDEAEIEAQRQSFIEAYASVYLATREDETNNHKVEGA